MSFLSIAFLAALPLVAIPVLVHLYRGKQRDDVDWGAMDFLVQAVTDGRRFERLEELLVMLLRTLAVAALVLALARPLVSSAWFGGGSARDVILVLDDSMSTTRVAADGEEVAATIRTLASDFVADLGPKDRAQLMLAASAPEWITPQAVAGDSAGRSRLTDAIEEIQPIAGRADLLACLRRAIQQEPAADTAARTIVVFTDATLSTLR